jgi:hypothetical protein
MKKKIHHTYDKKTLVEIIKQLGLNINVCQTRHQICSDLIKNYVEPFNLFYLYDKNPEPKLTIIKRKEIVYIAKQVSAYCLSYNKDDIFDTHETFLKNVEYILPYGDTPSVRKAIQRVNLYYRLNYKTHISPHTQSILDRQKIVKEHINPKGLKIKRGKFIIRFDD